MKKIYKSSCKVVFMLMFLIAVSMFFHNSAYADTITKIYVNGYNSAKYPAPVIVGGHSYVPADELEVLLGYSFDYDKDSKVVTLSQSEFDIKIQMSINVDTAVINKEITELPSKPFLENGEPMVPLRFVSEAIGGKVVWTPAFLLSGHEYLEETENKILIYSPHAVKLDSGNASIASKIYTQSFKLNDSTGRERNIGYDLAMPVLSDMTDTKFQNQLNDKFLSIYESIKKETEDIYNEQKNEIAEFRFDSSNDLWFVVADDTNDILPIVFDEYVYMGGAHGMPYRYVFNIDFSKSKILSLSDLFVEGNDYTKILVDKMNTIRLGTSSNEYNDVNEIKVLPETQIPFDIENGYFYIKDGNLCIFYHPYELSFYARGYVDFRIPLKDLNEYIADEYK